MSSVAIATLKPSPGRPDQPVAPGRGSPRRRSVASGCGAITSMSLGDAKPGCVGVDEEGREAARAGRLAGAREHDVDVGDAAVGDPGLHPVEHVGVAVEPWPSSPARRRRSRRRAPRARRPVIASPATTARRAARAFCASRAEERDRRRCRGPASRRRSRPGRRGRRAFRARGTASARRARALRRSEARAGARRARARGRLASASRVVVGERAERRRRRRRARRFSARWRSSKNGQVEEAAIGHQSPSKTGCSRAAKAR